jgi:hypothetical protein
MFCGVIEPGNAEIVLPTGWPASRKYSVAQRFHIRSGPDPQIDLPHLIHPFPLAFSDLTQHR